MLSSSIRSSIIDELLDCDNLLLDETGKPLRLSLVYILRSISFFVADLGEEEQVPSCTNINYFQSWARIEEADTTNSILSE